MEVDFPNLDADFELTLEDFFLVAMGDSILELFSLSGCFSRLGV